MNAIQLRVAALVAVGSLTTSCALPPPSNDIQIGAELAKSVEQEIGTYPSDEMNAYVEVLGQRLAAKLPVTPFTYKFSVLDQPEPNAFAAPGGFIYISRGLIALAQTEDELAGVIGHEITHVEQRHTAKRMARSTLPGILSIPGRVVGGMVSRDLGRIVNSPISTIGALSQASYGRGQESESDRIGQDLAASVGYDPRALAGILDRMEAFIEQLTEKSRRPTFFDSHPPTPTRSREILDRAPTVTVAERDAQALDQNAFLLSLDGLVYGVDPAQGEFRDNLFVHPVLGIAIEFPVGWTTVNTRSMAGAVAPSKEAFMFYGVTGRGGADAVEEIATQRRDGMRAEAGLEPSRDEKVEIGGRDAHVLVYTEGSGSNAVHVFQVVLAAEGYVHEFLGVGTEADRDTVRGTLESLRRLTDEEVASFTIDRIRIVEARQGETVAQIVDRSSSAVDARMTGTINSVDPAEQLPAGRLVKIVEREPFRP